MSQAFRSRGPSSSGRAELYRDLARWRDIGGEFNPLFQLANANCGMQLTLCKTLLCRIDHGRGEPLAARLLVGGGNVTSAEHGYRLFDLAEIARRDPDALAFLRGGSDGNPGQGGSDAAWTSLPDASPFRRAFSRYLQEFGHRAINESEVANPRWVEDPGYLLDLVRGFVEAGGDATADPREAAALVRRSAEADLRRASRLWRPLVRWSAARARRALSLRESARSAMMASMEPVRWILLETGRQMCAGGLLEAPEDVFHLAPVDVETYLLGRWDGAGATELVADRRARRDAWLAEASPRHHLLVGWSFARSREPCSRFRDRCRIGRSLARGRRVAGDRLGARAAHCQSPRRTPAPRG